MFVEVLEATPLVVAAEFSRSSNMLSSRLSHSVSRKGDWRTVAIVVVIMRALWTKDMSRLKLYYSKKYGH